MPVQCMWACAYVCVCVHMCVCMHTCVYWVLFFKVNREARPYIAKRKAYGD